MTRKEGGELRHGGRADVDCGGLELGLSLLPA